MGQATYPSIDDCTKVKFVSQEIKRIVATLLAPLGFGKQAGFGYCYCGLLVISFPFMQILGPVHHYAIAQ